MKYLLILLLPSCVITPPSETEHKELVLVLNLFGRVDTVEDEEEPEPVWPK